VAEGREGRWVVVEQPSLSFAGLLRRLRAEARLTQEELAEAAGLSPRTVSDLERGIHSTAHKDTAVLLADALGLAGPVSGLFVAAARGRAQPEDVAAAGSGIGPGAFAASATRTLPRDIAAFTGRQAELDQLTGTLTAMAANGGVVGIHAIDGMAGIGKTSFAVHAAHRLAAGFPDGQFFLPLHAHTQGQRPVDPADALASLLLTAGLAAPQIPPGLQARAARWRDVVAGKKILLLLDDAVGHEQVRPLLPGTAGSLVLVTSRRRLTALHDAAVITLDTLSSVEAATLLARMAARPGIRAGDAAVGQITQLCGYLPLAVGILASHLRHHPTWPASRLAAELVAARNRLALMRAENLSVSAAFGLSYADLTPIQQRLFRHLGLVSGPDFDARAAAALDGTGLDEARRGLDALYDQHLVTEPAPGRYQLHDLLREHARALASDDDPADRDAAIGRLLDYYLHTALAAGQSIPTFYPGIGPLPPACPPEYAPSMPTPGQAAAWLEAERANLQAATGHAAAAAARQSGDRAGQARALLQLSEPQFSLNDRAASVAASQQALELYRDLGNRPGQAEALNGLGFVHRVSGDYHAAATCHQQALELYRDLGNLAGQAESLNRLGSVQQETGDYRAAAANHQHALELFRDLGDRPGQSVVLIELGTVQRLTGDYQAAAATFRQAQEMGRDRDDRYDQAWILNQLGMLQRLAGDYPAAAASHRRALETFCELGEPAAQGFTRNELGLVQQLTGDYPAAAASHQQALRVLRDAGEPHGQACVLNSLGELASRTSATGEARDHHRQALAIARDLGAPLEEACALEGIGHSHLQDGNKNWATTHLRDALAIYQRIGSPAAQRVEETLHQHRSDPTPPQPATTRHPGNRRQRLQ
jgi:tetratricopeptide (TPR) repeat protein/transcriptional regulator with XRE-family HTH domain